MTKHNWANTTCNFFNEKMECKWKQTRIQKLSTIIHGPIRPLCSSHQQNSLCCFLRPLLVSSGVITGTETQEHTNVTYFMSNKCISTFQAKRVNRICWQPKPTWLYFLKYNMNWNNCLTASSQVGLLCLWPLPLVFPADSERPALGSPAVALWRHILP